MTKNSLLFLSFFIFLTLSGCSTTQNNNKSSPDELAEAQDALDRCLEATGIRSTYSNCMGEHSTRYIKRLGSEAEKKAEKRWDEIVENSDPNYKLMASVLRKNSEMINEAISEGADVNVAMTKRQVYNERADNENVTPLGVALEALDIDIALELIEHGADIQWRDPDNHLRDVASDNWFGKDLHRGSRVTYSWDPLFFLLEQGYTPSPKTLYTWYRAAYHHNRATPESEEAFLALKRNAKPEDLATFERLAKEAAERDKRNEEINAQRRAEAKKRREEAGAQLQARMAELEAANRQRTQHMRHVGAQICQNVRFRMSDYVRVGYVERIADDKVQIRVTRMYLRGAPGASPGGFQPGIIWDSLDNWYSCN